MVWLYRIRRRLFRTRRRQWRPFMLLRRLGAVLLALLILALALRAWGRWRRVGGASLVARLPDTALVSLIALHPGGDRLLVRASKQGAPLQYGIVDLPRSTFTPLPQRCTLAFFWSRDGGSILCKQYEPKKESLFWYRPSGGEAPVPAGVVRDSLSEVARHGIVVGTPSYTGERLLCFRVDSYGTRFAWWGRADGRGWERFPLPLGLTIVSESSPGYAPDGKQVALDWTIPLPEGAKARRLTVGTPGGRWQSHRLPPDTARVYWLDSDGTFVVLRDKAVEVLHLSRQSSTAVFREDWRPDFILPSPDGRRIALSVQPRLSPFAPASDRVGLSPLSVVDVRGRKLYDLAETSGSAVWSSDSKTLYFARGGEVRALRLRD